ncbi:MAG: hypothetical protein ABI833_22850 [Acidobacteriota bacterium]
MSIKSFGAVALLFAFCAVPAWPQALIIPQIVDGEVWQTTIVLTNTSTSSTNASLSFFQETTGNATVPWNLSFLEVGSTQTINLAASETLLLHTPGTAAALSVGWGQLTAGPNVVAYAIFTKRPLGLPAQVGTAPALASTSRVLVPFDNTSGNTESMALVNPSAFPETIAVKFRTTEGAISQGMLANVPAYGHIAFTFPAQFGSTAGQSGLAEFYAGSSGSIAILALNFNPAGSLTTAPVYPQSGPPIIGAPAPGFAPFSTFGPVQMLFQPAGFAAGNVVLLLTPNGDGTYSAQLNSGVSFTNGVFTGNGISFSASILQPNATVPPYGYFLAPDTTLYVVSSGSVNFSISASVISSNHQSGNLTGTLSITGTPVAGGAPVTFVGPITGPYYATLAP